MFVSYFCVEAKVIYLLFFSFLSVQKPKSGSFVRFFFYFSLCGSLSRGHLFISFCRSQSRIHLHFPPECVKPKSRSFGRVSFLCRSLSRGHIFSPSNKSNNTNHLSYIIDSLMLISRLVLSSTISVSNNSCIADLCHKEENA